MSFLLYVSATAPRREFCVNPLRLHIDEIMQ